MSDKEISRLTAEINQFAISQNWLPKRYGEKLSDTWRSLRRTNNKSTSPSDDLVSVWEMCSDIHTRIWHHRHARPFKHPVDPERDGVPDYYEVIRKPMDLRTVRERLAMAARRGREPLKPFMYKDPSEFKADMDLIWKNCFLYNMSGDEVHKMGVELKAEFEKRWEDMRIEEALDKISKKGRNSDLSKRPAGKLHKKFKQISERTNPKPDKSSFGKRHTAPTASNNQRDQICRRVVKSEKTRKVNSKKASHTSEGREVSKILQGCRQSQSIKTSKTPAVEWKPPIQRGGGFRSEQDFSKPREVPQETRDTLAKCRNLYGHLQKATKSIDIKTEEKMSDFSARRFLSSRLESISANVVAAMVARLSKSNSSKTGEITMDELDIKDVRFLVGKILKSQKDSERKAEKRDLSSQKNGGHQMPMQVNKKKKMEDDVSRLATKTPMVRPPSPPWHRPLTLKRQTWDHAVGLCGVTAHPDVSELGLTPRQESNGSSWEEIPDDDESPEEGEILD